MRKQINVTDFKTMKYDFGYRFCIGLLALSLVGMWSVGCDTTQSAYKTLGAVGETVNTAMNIYGEVYRMPDHGGLSDEEIEQVRSFHADFQEKFRLAEIAAGMDFATRAPQDLADMAANLVLFIGELKK